MDAEAMVTQLRASEDGGREDVLQRLFAETIDFSHVPPNEHDGRVQRDRLIAGARAERARLQQAIADYTSTHTYEADGDSIVERYHQRGTLDDGTVLDLPITIIYAVLDSAITGMRAEFDPDRASPVNRVLRAARDAPSATDRA